MPKGEQEALLEDKNYYNQESESTWPAKIRACLYCFLCIVFVVGSILSVFVLVRHYKGSSTVEVSDSANFKNFGLPKNISDLMASNSQLCNTVSSKDKPSTSYGPSNIYIVKGDKNLTNEQACGIESILRLFPDKTIYLINFNPAENKTYTKCSPSQNYLGLLLYLYKDRLQILPAKKADFFKNTPFQSRPIPEDYFVFIAMVLTAYKYGGFVATPDVAMTSRDPLDCFPEETIVNPLAVLTSRKCDDFLHYLMQNLNLCNLRNTSVDVLVNKTVELYGKSRSGKAPVRALTCSEICSNVKKPCNFLRLQQFESEPTKWLGDVSGFCKQVVQAYLGIKLNKMEVEEETSRIRDQINHGGRKCADKAALTYDDNSND